MNMKKRCPWCLGDSLYEKYHDNEWGCEVHDDRKLFEMLILEGMQAGLSWITILKRRENYRIALDNFDYRKIALYDSKKIEELMNNEGIIRNKLKINSIVTNAKAFLNIIEKYGTFNDFIWSYVDFKPIVNHPKSISEIPAATSLSDKISKDLKKMGFKFVGSTIIYSFMQATGMVCDHITECFVYKEMIEDKN